MDNQRTTAGHAENGHPVGSTSPPVRSPTLRPLPASPASLETTATPTRGSTLNVERWLHSPTADSGGEGTWHSHRAVELTLVESGAGTRYVRNQIAPFGRGDLVLLRSEVSHLWQAAGTCEGITVHWDLPATHSLWTCPEMLPVQSFLERAAEGIQLTGATARVVAQRIRELADVGGPSRLAVFLQLLADLADSSPADQRVLLARTPDSPAEKHQRKSIEAAVQHIFTHLQESIRLEHLLRITHMSRPTFCRHFRQQMGRSVREFVQEVRLAAVRRELEATDRAVTEIALECGFSQVSFFNRVFRRAFGCAPSNYRLRCRARERLGRAAGMAAGPERLPTVMTA
jgi:AraC-like DNA-binding protein